jgi:uncharacterized lipoprotein YddW (UPF0748 family)
LLVDAAGNKIESLPNNLERADFMRALYVDALGPTLKSPTSIKKLIQDCRENGFDTVVAQVRVYGDALYKSDFVPRSVDLTGDFDPLDALCKEARSGVPPIKVHALLVTLRVAMKDTTLQPKHVALEHRDWLTRTKDGSEAVGDEKNELWLDPGVVEVQDHIALVASEIARRYPVDGIQLDRVRYPDVTLQAGYNPKALARFKESGGAENPDPKDPKWIEWRRDQVTELLRKTREAVRAARPGTLVSAAAITYGTPAESAEAFVKTSTPGAAALCDWLRWGREGIVDFIALMNYKAAATRANEFEGWTKFALENKGQAKVVVVVGGWLNSSKHTAALMLLPIFDARADGVGLYSYHQPAAGGELPEAAFSVIRSVLKKESVARRIPQLAPIVTAPLANDKTAALARLEKLTAVLSGAGAVPVASTAATPALPSLAGASASPTPAASLPPLQAAMSAVSATPQAGLPSLAQAAPQGITSALPPLSAAAQAAAPSSGLPVLAQAITETPAPQAPPAAPLIPTLPPLSAAATQPAPAQPSGEPLASATGAPALPPLTAKSTPESTPPPPAQLTPPAEVQASTAAPMLPPLAPPATTPAPVVAQQAAPINPFAGMEPPTPAPPLVPALQVTPPTELAPAAAATPQPESSTAFAEQLKRMGIPSAETRGSINIPAGTTGETNFSAAAVSTPPPAPTFVAPTVVAPAEPTRAPVNVSALMPKPTPKDFSSSADSPFFRQTPAAGPRNYAPAPAPTTPVTVAGGGDMEIIVLKNGSSFVGKVLERQPSVWKIRLPNGSVIAVPAAKIAGTRPMTPQQ